MIGRRLDRASGRRGGVFGAESGVAEAVPQPTVAAAGQCLLAPQQPGPARSELQHAARQLQGTVPLPAAHQRAAVGQHRTDCLAAHASAPSGRPQSVGQFAGFHRHHRSPSLDPARSSPPPRPLPQPIQSGPPHLHYIQYYSSIYRIFIEFLQFLYH